MDQAVADKAALLAEALSKPVDNYKAPTSPIPETRTVERRGNSLDVTVPVAAMESGAADELVKEGLDPTQWEVVGFRRSEWGEGKVSTRFTFRRRTQAQETPGGPLTEAELDMVREHPAFSYRPPESLPGASTAIVTIADTQFGKAESDPAEVLARTYAAIDTAVAKLARAETYRGEVERIVVAFMGDHIEGFVSQGGANAWRTTLPLTDQIRLTRRMMIYAMQRFSEFGLPLSMVAVPGNHDQAVRFGTGITTYDDSHDVEALVSVMDAARMVGKEYDHVSFHVPETDELSVSLNLSGTHTVFNHGYNAKPMKFHEYAMKQANDSRSLYYGSKLVIYGHHHHLHAEIQGERMVVVCPAGETASQWFRHQSGIWGAPGVLLMFTAGGYTDHLEVIR